MMSEAVRCELQATETEYRIQFQLHNTQATGWQFLRWHTPFDTWFSEFMSIKVNGKPLEYQGALVKRGLPQAEDFIHLAPMQTLTIDLDLSQAYALTAGHYQIAIAPIRLEALPKDGSLDTQTPATYLAHCNVLALDIQAQYVGFSG
jgi:hypothetical protein